MTPLTRAPAPSKSTPTKSAPTGLNSVSLGSLRRQAFACVLKAAAPMSGTKRDGSPPVPLAEFRAPVVSIHEGIPFTQVAMGPESVAATARAPLDVDALEWVTKVAWVFHGGTGALRLEFGKGRFRGASLVVSGDGSSARVVLEGVPDVEATRIAEALAKRLAARGCHLEEFSVK